MSSEILRVAESSESEANNEVMMRSESQRTCEPDSPI